MTTPAATQTQTLQESLAMQIGRIEGRQEQGLKRLDDTNQSVRDLSVRIDVINGRLNDMNGRMDDMNGRIDEMSGRMDDMNGRIDVMNGRMDDMNGRIDEMGGRIDGLHKRIDRLFYAVIAVGGGVLILLVKDILGL